MRGPAAWAAVPVNINIPGFLKLIAEGDFRGAVNLIKETNALPAITGRVCPQEEQCEGDCVLCKRFESVGIGRLERFVADWEAAQGPLPVPELPPPTGKKVAVVGSGPAGLTVAADLARMGHARDHLRGAARAGRRADLRHPRVPPAQGDRASARSTTCAAWASSW